MSSESLGLGKNNMHINDRVTQIGDEFGIER
jgi:hypothetical protein